MFKMTKIENEEAALRFARILKRMGIDEALEKAGAKKGDTVRILNTEFEIKD